MFTFRLILVFLLLFSAIAGGQQQNERTENSKSFAPDFLMNLETSIDSLFHHYLEKVEPIQGGVISIVSDDSIYVLKGYGLADVESRRPFDPYDTHVMIASVSKLITATSILQLLDQGKLHLDQPVSELIRDFEIDNRFSKPVLVRHLLTHTAGFDDHTIGIEVRSGNELLQLKDFLKKQMPPVVWEPGKYYNYSNYGAALLLYIVESVSGTSYDTYLKNKLYSPLSMEMSGFRYLDNHANSLMTRYKWKETDDGELYLDDTYGIKYTNRIGAGGFKTTAKDMSAFMQMYLGNGEWSGKNILSSEIIKQGFSPQFSYHEAFDRKMGLIWNVTNHNGLNFCSHSGDDTGIESYLMLIPEANFGFFIASNNNAAGRLVRDIRNHVLENISPTVTKTADKPARYKSSTSLSRFSGTYLYMNDGQSSIEKLTSMFGDRNVVEHDRNALSINGEKYKQFDTNLFKRIGDNKHVVFIEDSTGIHFSTGFATYRKVSWYEHPSLHMLVLLGSFLANIISIITWSVQLIKRHGKIDRVEFKNKIILGSSAFFIILFFILLGLTTQGITLKYGVPWYFWIYFSLPLIGTALYVYGLCIFPQFIQNRGIGLISKIHTSIVVSLTAGCILLYHYYNLIGFNF